MLTNHYRGVPFTVRRTSAYDSMDKGRIRERAGLIRAGLIPSIAYEAMKWV
jgi:hypothetical protein